MRTAQQGLILPLARSRILVPEHAVDSRALSAGCNATWHAGGTVGPLQQSSLLPCCYRQVS